MKTTFIDNGFTDVLRSLGVTLSTSPWAYSGNGNSQWGNIDHILVRVAGNGWNPTSGVVHSNNLFQLYPAVNGQQGTRNQDQRIIKNFEITGSDHFPVSATFNVDV